MENKRSLKKVGRTIFFFIIFLFFILDAQSVSAIECGSVPTNNCEVTQNTAFNQGIYNFPNGISIGTNNVNLNCNGSTLIGSGTGNGIYNFAWDNSIIANCIIKNYSNGIFLDWKAGGCPGSSSSNLNLIQNNFLENNSIGIKSVGTNCDNGPLNQQNRIINNTFQNNTEGINLQYTKLTNITQNVFINNIVYGIHLTITAYENTIYNNTFYKTSIQYDYTNDNEYCLNGELPNSYLNGATGPPCNCLPLLNNVYITSNETICQDTYYLPNGIIFPEINNINLNCNSSTLMGAGYDTGIHIDNSDRLIIENCIIKNYSNGILLDWDPLPFSNCGASDFNILRNMILENNSIGINTDSNCLDPLRQNSNNKIINNTIRFNSEGIRLFISKLNNVTLNTIQNNLNIGIELTSSYVNDNNIFLNSIVNNTNQAIDSGVNTRWNISGQGNYWSNYDTEAEGCFDADSNLICDTPYNISGSAGSKDYLPTTGLQILDIIPIQVIKDVDMVKGKTTLVRSVIKNSGVSNKNINVSLYFEGSIKDSNITSINAGQEKDVDLWFIPDIAGSNKEIEIKVEES